MSSSCKFVRLRNGRAGSWGLGADGRMGDDGVERSGCGAMPVGQKGQPRLLRDE